MADQTSPPRVLIVDEPLVARALARLLQSRFAIVHRSTAVDALALLAQRDDYDAIVLDVDSASDRAAYEQLLLADGGVARRVIFVTSASDPMTETFIERVGRPWLMKPFASAQLVEELLRVVRSRTM